MITNVAKCGKMWQVKPQPILLEHLGTIKIHEDMFKPRAGRNPFCRLCWVQNSICHRSGTANIVLGDSMVIMGIHGLPGCYLARLGQIKDPSDFCHLLPLQKTFTPCWSKHLRDWGGTFSTKWNRWNLGLQNATS